MAESTKFKLVLSLLTEDSLSQHYRYDGPLSFPTNVYDSPNTDNDLKDGEVAFLLHFVPGSSIQQMYFRSSDPEEIEAIIALISENYTRNS